MRIIFLVVTFITVVFGCKKNIPDDTLVSKMAGTHLWTGTETIYKAAPQNHFIDTFYSITFSTVLYALEGERIIFFDSYLGGMDTLNSGHIDTITKTYQFTSYYNIMNYFLSNDSIDWHKTFLRDGKRIEWDLHSP